MKITTRLRNGRKAILTNEHPMEFVRAVLLVDRQVYRPGDIIDGRPCSLERQGRDTTVALVDQWNHAVSLYHLGGDEKTRQDAPGSTNADGSDA